MRVFSVRPNNKCLREHHDTVGLMPVTAMILFFEALTGASFVTR